MSLIGSLAAVILVAVLAEGVLVIENGLPIQWDQVPAQLNEMPVVNGVVMVNPWDFQHRMGIHRILIGSTDPYMGSMGPGTKENPFYMGPVGLGWQLRSGRLADPTGRTTCGQKDVEPNCISTNSWWACMKYWLSVIPFLAAVQAGVIGDGQVQVQIQVPAEASHDYCTSFSDCSTRHPELMSKWEAFFQSLKSEGVSNSPDPVKRDEILGLLWTVQDLAFNTGLTSCAARQKSYSKPEISFMWTWVMSADFFAASRVHSSLEYIVPFMSPLPSRILQEGDNPPNIADFSIDENHNLYVFGWMESINRLVGGSLTTVWKRAMCSQATREKGQALMTDMIVDNTFAFHKVVKIVIEMMLNC